MASGHGVSGLWQAVERDGRPSGTAARMCASVGGDRRKHRLLALDRIAGYAVAQLAYPVDPPLTELVAE